MVDVELNYLHLVYGLLAGCDVRENVGETLCGHFRQYTEKLRMRVLLQV